MRCFVTYMMAHPGKKLQFMGTEFAQKNEWNFEKRAGMGPASTPGTPDAQNFFRAVNRFLSQPAGALGAGFRLVWVRMDQQ